MKKFLACVLFLGCFGALCGWAMQAIHDHRARACETKGGTFYCAYPAPCLCLARGTVLQ